ncbi:PE family protein [Mycobacterium marseillense]|uniref:PE family protein n=1 Tax=Mycobacterium marseillense TaxID=701042 RepID=A0AAC9VTC3_9MYCO|nr:PE family protein [Mycobacterium marseillense]ASW89612.1 PE family protein [Mycobacterium marseillense]MCA2262969.1 PE family protein [Mycobacterium marseillense]MCV7405425.1 PE family protein [Mycobacterium marseillense]MDM3974935.1 PE family protein [Mycobacterium marseillense]OBJ66588.1 PE family protein [Mycobacterium marseillense]
MSFVTTQPEALSAAAQNLAAIGGALAAQNAAASAPTMGVVPAATDEVSVLVATQFAAHAQMYQNVCAQATVIHDSFVRMLHFGASSYAATEAINAAASS